MARLETNRSGEMEVFVRVVERGGFSSASRDFNMTPSAVSKLVGRLEDRLGTRLFNRSTRKLHLTSEGQRFYERALDIIAYLNDAEQEAATAMAPSKCGASIVDTKIDVGPSAPPIIPIAAAS